MLNTFDQRLVLDLDGHVARQDHVSRIPFDRHELDPSPRPALGSSKGPIRVSSCLL